MIPNIYLDEKVREILIGRYPELLKYDEKLIEIARDLNLMYFRFKEITGKPDFESKLFYFSKQFIKENNLPYELHLKKVMGALSSIVKIIQMEKNLKSKQLNLFY